MRANVANFQHAVFEQLALNIQVVVLHVGRAQLGIDSEYVRIGEVAEDGHAVLNRSDGRKREQYW